MKLHKWLNHIKGNVLRTRRTPLATLGLELSTISCLKSMLCNAENSGWDGLIISRRFANKEDNSSYFGY